MVSRRRFLEALAAAAAVQAAPPAPRLGLYLDQFDGDLAAILANVAAMGYRDVELGGLRSQRPSELRKLLDHAGLRCKSACWTMWENDADSQDTLDTAVELGLEYMVTPLPSLMGKEWFLANETPAGARAVAERMTVNDWRWNADWFNHVGGLAQKNNIQFVYRNHSFEFAKLGNSTGFEELWQRTEPTRVKFELDCAAATAGGCDPADFLKRYGSRTVLLHIADRADWPGIQKIAGDRPCYLAPR